MPRKTPAQLDREIAHAMKASPTDADIIDMIEAIDGFHGNELKERSSASIQQEIRVIRTYLQRFIKD